MDYKTEIQNKINRNRDLINQALLSEVLTLELKYIQIRFLTKKNEQLVKKLNEIKD